MSFIAGAPQLSEGFSDFHAHQVVALLQSAPGGSFAGSSQQDAARFLRKRHEGQVGLVVVAASLGVQTLGVVVLFSSGFSNGAFAAGLGMILLGDAGLIVGDVLMFDGGINASLQLGRSATVGWVGVGLSIGGVVLSPIAGLGGALTIGGIVCGAVQLGQASQAGRESGILASVHVVPTPNGMLIAGRF